MGHNSVVLGHLKSIGILRVDGLSTGPSDLGHHKEDMPEAQCRRFAPAVAPFYSQNESHAITVQIWNLRHSRHLWIIKCIDLEPIFFAINLDIVLSSKVFSIFDYVFLLILLLT